MEFPPEQDRALVEVDRWLKDPSGEQVFTLFGYAGTGKTTLAKYLAANVDGHVVFAAFTGKAAHVLRRKGCPNATTIHKLIYRPSGNLPESDPLKAARERLGQAKLEEDRAKSAAGDAPGDQLRDSLRLAETTRMRAENDVAYLEGREKTRPAFSYVEENEAQHARLIVLDECSMVDARMGADLEKTGARLLVLGDPAQLPPVGGGGYFTERRPRVLLTEIHRQARDSGILRLATDVREGKSVRIGKYGEDCEVMTARDERREALARDADQVLCGRNRTRHASNAKMRTLLGLGDGKPFPVPGDRLVCLRNNHDVGLLNGSTWRVHQAQSNAETMLTAMELSSIEDVDAPPVQIGAWLHHFMGRESELVKMGLDRRSYEEFDHGFALTVHKSQGSQFDDVYLFDESGSFGQDAQRHLYTGVTRAAKSLTVVRP